MSLFEIAAKIENERQFNAELKANLDARLVEIENKIRRAQTVFADDIGKLFVELANIRVEVAQDLDYRDASLKTIIGEQ